MRLFALALAAVIAAAAPAQAAWKAQKYPQYGFGVDFPAEPKMTKGEYRGVIAGRVPTTIIGAEEDGIAGAKLHRFVHSNREAQTS